MAIRFHCRNCRQLLAISRRKAGAEIACPRCGTRQTVPQQETAETSAPGPDEDEILAILRSDVLPALSVLPDAPPSDHKSFERDAPRPREPVAKEMTIPGPAGGVPPKIRANPTHEIITGRHSLLLPAIVLLAFGALTFVLGYVVGQHTRGTRSPGATRFVHAARQPLQVEGKVMYDPGRGQLAADAQAVVILVPDEKLPEMSVPIEGLRPDDPPPGDDHPGVRIFKSLDGAYARTDAAGQFSLTLPHRGNFRVLIVSRHTRRPDASPILDADLNELRRYSRWAEHLIGDHKYSWSREQFDQATAAIHRNFGRDGE